MSLTSCSDGRCEELTAWHCKSGNADMTQRTDIRNDAKGAPDTCLIAGTDY